MVETVERIGRFTSSNIWKLTTKDRSGKSFGAPALTYIEEKRGERSLGRSLDLGKDSQATVWGKVAEHFCNLFHLDLSYSLISKETLVHPKYKFWSGSPDAKTETKGCEIKCFEPKKYYLLSMALIKLNDGLITLSEFKDEFKDVYWQVVSNCILMNKSKAEIIAFMPTQKQLYEIRKAIEETDVLEKLGIDPWKGRFISEGEIYNLPFVKNENYPNFVKHEFDVPTEDVIFLTKCVTDAEKLLSNG